MSKFKIGDKVVAVKDHSMGCFKKGDGFIVDGFTCCPHCGIPCIYLKGTDRICASSCRCGFEELSVRECYAEHLFEKPISLAEATEYKLKISIPELLEIKEVQKA